MERRKIQTNTIKISQKERRKGIFVERKRMLFSKRGKGTQRTKELLAFKM